MNILTIGTFDVPHMGHYSFLCRMSDLIESQNNRFIVAVNSDEFVERFKGKAPVFTLHERMKLIGIVPWVDVVKNTGDENVMNLIIQYKAEVIVIGSDWHKKDYLKQLGITQEWLDKNKIALLYIPYTEIISTSEIKRRLK